MAKAVMKTYALGIGMYECYDAIINKKRSGAIKALFNIQGFMGVHSTDRVQVLLYQTPAARRKAYQMAKRLGFQTAMIITNTDYVPSGDMPLPEVQRNDADD